MEIANQIRGKKSRASGARLERRVREDLIRQGFIVDRWTQNVDLEKGMVVPAKSNRFGMRTAGFPDLIALRKRTLDGGHIHLTGYCILVEVKTNGYLDQTEHQKMKFLLNSKYFDAVYIAKKGKKRGELLYSEYKEEGVTSWQNQI